MPTTIYVLELKEGKIYVGKTDKFVKERIIEHIKHYGSAWTQKYEPIRLIETSYGDVFDEDRFTKKYMMLCGVENVRGGSYVEVELPDYQLKALNLELCSVLNKCFKCGMSGHYANSCPNVFDCKICRIKTHNTNNCCEIMDVNGNVLCNKCRYPGHYKEDCRSVVDAYGNKLNKF